jgi:putative MATE family efflux protein
MAIIQALGFFFGQGAGNYISRTLGAQNSNDAGRMAATGFFSAFAAGCMVMAAGLIFMNPLARLLGATDAILPFARAYLRFILIGAPFMVSSLMLNNILRFQGSAMWAMVGMISGAVLNIGLDPLFIYVLGMGVAGASLATMISQAVSCILLLVVSCVAGNNVRISLRNFSPSIRLYVEIVRGGIPSLLRQGLQSLAVIVLNRAAGVYGDGVIAAFSIVNRIFLIGSSALIGLGQGFQPVCGFNYGAKQYERVKRAFRFSVKLGTAILVLMAVFCFIFAPQVIAAFRKDDAVVIGVGAVALRYQCFGFPLTGWVIFTTMTLQTTGKAVPASILSVARQGLFLIPLLCILSPLLGVFGLQLCSLLSDFCAFILAVPMGVRALRNMGKGDSPDHGPDAFISEQFD